MLARALLPVGLLLAFAGVAVAQDGCAPSVPTVTPDGSTASVFFDSFSVSAGSGGKSSDTVSCSVRVPVQLPAPDSLGVYKVEYRGGVELGVGQTAQFTATPGFGSVLQQRFAGADTQDYLLSQLVGSGGTGGLDFSLRLDLQAGQLGDALAALDSADIIIVDYTRFSSVSASIDTLATERATVMTHLGSTADLLLGFVDPIAGADETRVLAAGGSTLVGAQTHQELTAGFSILAGAAYFADSLDGAEVSGFPLLAGAVRYVQPGSKAFRPFAEGGAWGSPDLSLHFARRYENRTGQVDTAGDTSGSIFGLYGRAGMIFVPNARNEFSISATLSQTQMHADAYSERGGAGNLFPASIDATSSSGTAFKGTVAWTGALTGQLDLTLSAAAGHTFGGSGDVTAVVDYVGPVTGHVTNVSFVEYGGRLGWNVTEAASVDGFVFGTTGDAIGTSTRYGGALRLRF